MIAYSQEDLQREYLRRKLEALQESAPTNYFDFVRYVGRSYYRPAQHQKRIADEINQFISSEDCFRLMLFVPPQHGKSELTSRNLPPFLLGNNPDLQIVISSYSSDLAGAFNEAGQKVMQSDDYKRIFPKNELDKCKGEETTLANGKGKVRAVGVTGGLTGHSVDFAIIDDPVKDAIEASSTTYRERVWQWYLNVLETRLHNASKVVLIMTRWHENDLAGRLLELQPHKWRVIRIPAIKEDNSDELDERSIGEPLWPNRHSLEKLNDLRALSEVTFSSLYQQRPAPAEGNKVRRDWWQYIHEKELPTGIVWDLWVDGAYTDKSANDPTGLMVAGFHALTKRLFVKHAHHAHMEMPALLNLIPEYCERHGLDAKGRVMIEPKASGKSIRQMINADPALRLSAVEIKSYLVQEGKEARLQVAAPKVEVGSVVLVKGDWNDKFVTQICSFPNATHDEYVDLLGYAVDEYFTTVQKRYVKVR